MTGIERKEDFLDLCFTVFITQFGSCQPEKFRKIYASGLIVV